MSKVETTALEFDLSKITAGEMADFFDASNKNDLYRMADTFAKVVKRCPEGWGEPTDAQTFVNRPYFTEFKGIVQQFVEAANEQAKN
jgi:hypothetical protein